MPGSPIQTAHSSPFTPSRGATRSSTPYPISSSTAVSSEHYDISHLGPYGREWVEKYMRLDYRFKDHPQSAPLPRELFEDWEEFSFCEAVLDFGAKDYGMTTAEIAMWWERGVEELEAFDSVGSPDIRDLRRLQQRAQEEAGLLAGSPPPPFREYNVLYNRDGDFIGDSSEPRSPRSGGDPRSPIAGPMAQLLSLSHATRDAEHLPVPTPAPPFPLVPLQEARPIAPRPRRNTDLSTTSRPYLSSGGLDHPCRSAAGSQEHTGLRPPPTRPRIIIPASSRRSPFFPKDNDLAQGDPVQRRISDPGNRPRRSFFQSLLSGGGPPLQVLRSALRQQTTATIALLPPVEVPIALPQTEAGAIGVLQAQLRSVTKELEEMRRHLIYQATTLQSSREDLEHFGRRVEELELRNDVDRSMRLPAANAHVTGRGKQPAA